ncbi:MAG: hypothetical protein R2828_04395 [Saprospiraceae bacterium]
MSDFRKQFNIKSNPFNSVTSVIMMVLLFVALFYIARFIFRLLWLVAPILLVAAIIVDYKTVLGYVKWIGSLLQKNPMAGVVAILLSALGFPLVSGFLLMKGLFKKKVKEATQAREAAIRGEFVEYEEIVDDDALELPPLEVKKVQQKQRPSKSDSEYDQFFDQ